MLQRHKKVIIAILLFFSGVLFIFSSYAWFSTNLNVKIKNFNMVVSRNGGLTISFDAINYDTSIEITRDNLITNLTPLYPNHINQWALNGLIPVSSNGISDPSSYFFDMYGSTGVKYRNKKKENGFIYASKIVDTKPRSYNNYIAFDIFFKNVTGSPVPDNLYYEESTAISMTSDGNEEMVGLTNSLRIGIVKVGTLPIGTDPELIQNMQCQDRCEAIIFEPYSRNHTELSIERARKYDINLIDGKVFPTYAMVKAGGPLYIADNISGSPTLDLNYFSLQNTIHEEDFSRPLFDIPDGVTKARVYVWIEGQDIDSLETDSEGAELLIDINFIKDTVGYDTFN